MASAGGSDGAPPAGLQPSASSISSSRLQNATRLTYKELQDSTNDFSEERRIGEGAYGEVYLGMLENGEEVAVKRLYNRNYETYDQQFTHEFENLMTFDHPNIVQLVGYCYEIQHIPMQCMGKTTFVQQIRTALCFEYMQKGSLEKHLSDEHGGLDWRTRYKIIKQTWEGLKHIHEGGFYHLDLKPDNILLDVNMVAKLADFGMSKIFGDEQNKDPELVIGTYGYLPPEYIEEKLVSKKLDIFSLGVVMTKIIAGPAGHTRCAQMSNQKFLRQVNENWRNRLKARWNSPGSLQAYCKQVNECTKIAMKCMDKDRNVRPSIVDIINELNKTEHSIATKLWPYASVDADTGGMPFFSGKRKAEHNQPPPVSSTSAVVRPDAPPPSIPLAPSSTTLQHELFYSQPPPGLLKITERVYVLDSCLMADVLYDDKYRQYIRDIVLQVRSDYNNAHVKVFNFQEGRCESLLSHVLSSYEITVMEYPMQYEGFPLLTMEMIHHFLRSGEIWLSMDQHNVLIMHCERGGLAVLAFMLAGLLLYQKQCTGEQTTLEMVYANAPRWLIRPLSPLNHMPSQIRYLQYISRRNVRYKWPPGERQLTLDRVILRSIPDFNDEVGCRPIFRIYGQEALLGLNDFPKVLFSTPKEYVRLYKQANDDLIKADIRCHVRGDVVLECINMDPGQERDVTIFRIMFNTAFIRSSILTLDRDQIDTMWYSGDRFPTDFRAEIFFLELSTANQLDPMDSSIQEKKGLPLPVEDSEGDEALVQQPANSPEIIELRQGLVSPPPPASTSSTVRPDAPPPPPLPSLPPGITSIPPPPPPPPPPPYHSSKQSSSGGGNANLFVAKWDGLARPLDQATFRRSNLKPLHWEKVTEVMKSSLWEEGQADEVSSEAIEPDMSELEELFSAALPYSDARSSDKVTCFEQCPDGAPPAGLQTPTSSSSRDDNTTGINLHSEAKEPTNLTMGLLMKITNNFSEERAIGEGSHGKVYRGVHDNGQEIAVKLLHGNIHGIDDEQFRHEVDNLMMLKHQNILRLVGYCYESKRRHVNHKGCLIFATMIDRALCSEYMHNGSLENHLSDECVGLDWHTRYKIIKGICEGLKYLHEGLEKPIYQLHLKPQNILLDKNMTPKLDFGLYKLFVGDRFWKQQNFMGIPGYLPPEYIEENLVSKKLDIFSLGVVMTEIIAGPRGYTRNAEDFYQGFLDQAQENWRSRLQATWSSLEALQAYCHQVNRCAEIAWSCMDIDRRRRPSIVDIIHVLNKTEIVIGNVT